jgi:toxin-antitoxin system PIN domain toxin
MTSLVFPDINVWLAMAFTAHAHHLPAKKWFDSLSEEEELVFCRFTQLGLLRLLTQQAIMGNRVKTQPQAWQIYDTFVTEGNARLMQEPRLLDRSFRCFASLDSASAQSWADCYLAAFAEEAGAILVTFDKALAGRVEGSILLGSLPEKI